MKVGPRELLYVDTVDLGIDDVAGAERGRGQAGEVEGRSVRAGADTDWALAPNRWTISSKPGTSTFKSHAGRYASYFIGLWPPKKEPQYRER
jgi:hypothetical protein